MTHLNTTTIPEYFAGKNVFITGGSGFIGRVLIEKLLRSCPDLQGIYLLLRAKRDKTPEERLEVITNLALFNRLKETHPDAVKKLKIVTGDVTKLGLGLSQIDRQTLIDEVHVVYHSAASVRFDDPLTKAILLNTRGTREVMALALEMKHLEVLTHISTTYAHTDKEVVEERGYDALLDWREVIEVAEKIDQETLEVMCPKYIAPMRNTYTFTKALAENVVFDMGRGKIPVVVLRPSIVVATLNDPMPGWLDNFNGPIGMVVGVQKGVIRTMYTDPKNIMDYMSVDIIVKGLIISTWKKVITRDPSRLEPEFYNASNNNIHDVSFSELINMGNFAVTLCPFNSMLWYPRVTMDQFYYYHLLKLFFYQIIPAILLDQVFRFMGHQPILMRIQRRVYNAMMSLQYFLHNSWTFLNKKMLDVELYLHPSDIADFQYTLTVDNNEYILNAALGARRYLMNEPDDTIDAALRNAKRMYVLAKIFDVVWYMGLIWLLFFKLDVMSLFIAKIHDIVYYFNN